MTRAYQGRMVAEVRAAWEDFGARTVLLQLPTGGGKTHTAASILREETGPVVFAAHLDSLVGDTAARLGVPCGIVAPWAKPEPQHRIQVCSLGTLHARGTRPPAGLVVLDECHRAQAPTVKGILEDYPEARILGLTATPQRGDGAPLGDIFEAMVQGPTVAELMADGYLCKYTLTCPARGRGDGAAELVSARGWTRALYFAETREAGEAVAERLRAAGVEAAEMYGETPRAEREKLRAWFRAAGPQRRALVGVGVFVEGFDEPLADAVVLDATFGTVGRYLQAIGRGLRPAEGKRGLLVLDVRGAVFLHGLPDEGRRWNLHGEAATRTEPGMRIATCPSCFAVFRAGPERCVRCGAPIVLSRDTFQREPTRAEKLVEYAKIPVDIRRSRYHAAMVKVATGRLRLSADAAERWAAKKTTEKFAHETL